MKLVFATNNKHKLEEVRQILPPVYDILSLSDIGFTGEIEENGDTLEANSMLKVRCVTDWLKARGKDMPDGVFADDTGLEVAALGGAPGVHTARYAGEPANDAANRRKLLEELRKTGTADRRACFRTVVTLERNGRTEQAEGRVDGTIATEEHGAGGFGYDSLFIPQGGQRCFAELTANEKNSISHRGRAMEELRKLLSEAQTS
ncbi:MAG: RdgB/HAM1 family non-canonical purine NTP pyrophosphatase [Paludibacteraceae bacterium]|nr:RdgB/HAM1 family non-canonical purine NTP pyrophosphatase [Paludibacteraceae bacterium]